MRFSSLYAGSTMVSDRGAACASSGIAGECIRLARMPKKAMITGITGQDGSYLAELLLSKGYEVHGLVRRTSAIRRERIDHLHLYERGPDRVLHLHYGDLGDGSSLVKLLYELEPDE